MHMITGAILILAGLIAFGLAELGAGQQLGLVAAGVFLYGLFLLIYGGVVDVPKKKPPPEGQGK